MPLLEYICNAGTQTDDIHKQEISIQCELLHEDGSSNEEHNIMYEISEDECSTANTAYDPFEDADNYSK